MEKAKIFKYKTEKLIANVFVMIFSITCIYPIIWMLYSSVKSNQEFNRNILSLPKEIHLENFVEAFKLGKLGLYSLNSVVSCALIILFSFIIAYFIARFKFRGRKILYMMFLFGMLVPIHALLVPVFIQYKELEEAALIDGSSFFSTMFRIVFPVCKPTLITVGILSFLDAWNEFPFALVLIQSDELKTISLGLLNFNGQYSTNYPVQMAGLLLAMLPIVIIYILVNKKIIEGMTAGAVKG